MSMDRQPPLGRPENVAFSRGERLQAHLPKREEKIMMSKLAHLLEVDSALVPGFEFTNLLVGFRNKCQTIMAHDQKGSPGQSGVQIYTDNDSGVIFKNYPTHHDLLPDKELFSTTKSHNNAPLWRISLSETANGVSLYFIINEGRRSRFLRLKQEIDGNFSVPAPMPTDSGEEIPTRKDFELP